MDFDYSWDGRCKIQHIIGPCLVDIQQDHPYNARNWKFKFEACNCLTLRCQEFWLKFPLARCCMEGIDITLGFWLFPQRQPNLEKNNLWFLCSICNWYQTFIVICWWSIKIGLWLLLQSHMSLEKRLRLEGRRPLMFLRKK